MRILLDCKYYNKNNAPIIMPYQRFSDRIKRELKNLNILNFGIEVKKIFSNLTLIHALFQIHWHFLMR